MPRGPPGAQRRPRDARCQRGTERPTFPSPRLPPLPTCAMTTWPHTSFESRGTAPRGRQFWWAALRVQLLHRPTGFLSAGEVARARAIWALFDAVADHPLPSNIAGMRSRIERHRRTPAAVQPCWHATVAAVAIGMAQGCRGATGCRRAGKLIGAGIANAPGCIEPGTIDLAAPRQVAPRSGITSMYLLTVTCRESDPLDRIRPTPAAARALADSGTSGRLRRG
jgi:hypothetical protein